MLVGEDGFGVGAVGEADADYDVAVPDEHSCDAYLFGLLEDFGV